MGQLTGEQVSDALETLKKLDHYLSTNVKTIVFKVPDEANAYQIFETLNDRGLDLSIADLLKNYVFGKAGQSKLDKVKDHWTTAISRVNVEGGEGAVLQFIHHFWSSKNGLIREKDLYKDIKQKIRDSSGAVEFCTELAGSAANYAAILNPEHEIWAVHGTEARNSLSTLKLLKLEQYRPLLLACMDTFDTKKPKEIVNALRLLVAWSVRFRVTGQLGSSKLEYLYGDAGKLVRDQNIRTANGLVEKLADKIPSDAEFRATFSNHIEPNGKIARYLLRSLENTERRLKGERAEHEVVADEAVVNLEHVLPKEATLDLWPKFTPESAPVFVYRIGNQTLLLKDENEKIGNKPFDKKLIAYARSSLLITKKLLSYKDWSADEIANRQEWLAGIAVRAWPNTISR